MVITQTLAGKRICITGATGFLGTAIVERLLRSVPHCEIVVLIRKGRRSSAEERLQRDLLRNNCFDRLRSELSNDFEEVVSRRLSVLSGDVTKDTLGLDEDGLQTLSSCDVVIHSAATVSFDAPLDSAVEVNLLGPARVRDAMMKARSLFKDASASSQAEMISVSTAYVTGNRKGDAREELSGEDTLASQLNWQEEVAAARRLRSDADAESRRPERLRAFFNQAHLELGAAGTQLIAKRAESLRSQWVKDQMVEAGRARAQMLGWPDAYAYTKALGERALVDFSALDSASPIPSITIVRPSIIESAFKEPFPGWIRGFRMAEPIIISYAKGLLKEFPGVPEGIVDVIPVDLVAAAIIAIAAERLRSSLEQVPPPRKEDASSRSTAPLAKASTAPASRKKGGSSLRTEGRTASATTEGSPQELNASCTVYHVSSGSTNPLRYGRLVELVRSFFGEHPLYDTHGQPIMVPAWSFPGRGRVQRQLERASRILSAGREVLARLPSHSHLGDLPVKLENRSTEVSRALEYVELYGAYAETEARFRQDRLIELWESLTSEDRSEFLFDPRSIDWEMYVSSIHLPSVVLRSRVRTAPSSKRPSRSRSKLEGILSPDRKAAVFDLEGTLVDTNVVESYLWVAARLLPSGLDRARLLARIGTSLPSWFLLDKRDRSDFLRSFYKLYEGAPLERIADQVGELFVNVLLAKAYPEGLARVRKHRHAGHKTVLVTGALDLLTIPFRALFDEVIASSMSVTNGILSGQLTSPPPIGEARSIVISEWADAEGIDLDEVVAYGDSSSDLPLLSIVGYPVAVNPDVPLASEARRQGWHMEHWTKSSSVTHLLPRPRSSAKSAPELALGIAELLSRSNKGGSR